MSINLRYDKLCLRALKADLMPDAHPPDPTRQNSFVGSGGMNWKTELRQMRWFPYRSATVQSQKCQDQVQTLSAGS